MSTNDTYLVGRQNSDTQVINDAMNNSFNVVVKALVYSTIIIIYLLILSPKLFGILLGGLITMTFVVGGLRRTTSQLNRQYLEEKSRLIHLSEETFSNIRTVKAFCNTRNEIKKFDEIN